MYYIINRIIIDELFLIHWGEFCLIIIQFLIINIFLKAY